MMTFTVEENNLIAMYPHENRQEILEELHQAVLYIKESKMLEFVQQTIEKILQMKDGDFEQEVFALEEE